MIIYTYDEIGNIIGLNYNDTQYYYIRNGQNDVIGILDSNLNQVVSYEYDSWGNTISIKDANGNEITSSSNIGIINPYRYRSYRYDTEIGLYYLNSRYYNPEWGRFINADGMFESGHELLGNNLYAYCNNNPVNMVDPDGESILITLSALATILAKAIVVTTVVTLVTYAVSGVGYVVSNIADNSSKNTTKNTKDKNATNTKSNNKTGGNNETQNVPKPPSNKYPTDPTKPPAPGYEWRGPGTPGTGKGAWFKPKTGSSLRDDLKHPKPIGPHWDYKPTRNSPSYRWFPDGRMEAK